MAESMRSSLLLALDETGHAVERHLPVIADDPALSYASGNPVMWELASPDVGGRASKTAPLCVFRYLVKASTTWGRVRSHRLQRVQDHAQTTVGHDRALQRRVGLQADDDFVVPVDVAGLVSGETGNLGDVEHSFSSLLNEQLAEHAPEFLRARGCRSQKRAVAIVRLVVLLNEIANVDSFLPESRLKLLPWTGRGCRFRFGRHCPCHWVLV